MGELYNPYPKLPKNIRQIGERDQIVRLYLEDYVNTYLKRLYPTSGQDLRAGLLLGSVEMHEGTPYIFIDGALEMEDVTETGEKVSLNDTAWKKAYQTIEQMFPKRTVQGWFLCGAQGSQLSPLNYWKEHIHHFPGQYKLMYLNSGLENEESVYITSEDGFYKLRGHSIYYERNQMMQDYMVLRKDARRVESGASDTVIRDFRQRMEERKIEVTEKRNTVSLLGGLCGVLSVVVLAGGIVMFNNYEKMREMESVITSVLPQKGTDQSQKKTASKTEPSEMEFPKNGGVIVEEAAGDVYPTTAAGGQAGKNVPGSSEAAGTASGDGGGKEAAAGVTAENAASAVSGTSGENSVSSEKPPTTTDGAAQTQEPKGASGGRDQAGSSQEKETPAAQAGAGVYESYVIQDGETLYGICLKFYHDLNRLDDIIELNGLDDQNKIVSGQKLLLPK